MSRERAIKIAGALNSDKQLEDLKVEAATWLKEPGKERVYLQSTGRKGGTRYGYVNAATGEFVPERFAGKNNASDAIVSRVREVVADTSPRPTAPTVTGLAAMAQARANSVNQPRGDMQRLAQESRDAGRVSGPAARGNYAKVGRSG